MHLAHEDIKLAPFGTFVIERSEEEMIV